MRRALGLLAVFAALTVLHTWPLGGNIAGLSRLDNDDAGLNVFVVSWIAHVVPRRPTALFEAPIFYPEPHTLAYSEHMLVPSLIGAPLIWAGLPPVTVYNVLVLLGFALSGWSMALVVRRWTSSTLAGVVAGCLYAFNAHLLTRLVHLQALHLEFLPVVLLAFDLVLRSPPGRTPWSSTALLCGAFVLQALCSNYTLVFLSVALVAASLVRVREWMWPLNRSRVAALTAAAMVAVLILAPFLWPYYEVRNAEGLARSVEEVASYSAGWSDYLATGGRLHYAWWSHRWFEGRTPLFPGFTALGLALIAIATPATRRDPRARMMLGIAIVGVALSFGPALPGYAWLHTHVPLFEGLRAAARWGLLPLIAIAVLAGFTVALLERRWQRHAYWPAASLLLIAVPTLEALRAPMSYVGVPEIPAIYDTLAREDTAVVVELPLFSGASVSENARYMLHSTRHFRPLVNGYSGFETEGFRRRAERWRGFPDPGVLDEMHALGVTHLVLHTRELSADQLTGAATTPRLRLVEEDGSRRLYRLDEAPR